VKPDIIFRHSRLILGVWLVLALAGGGLFLARFDLNNSVGVWFPKDDPALAEYERVLETFGPWEWSLLLLEISDPGDKAVQDQIAALAGRLEELPSIRQVLDPAEVAALNVSAARAVPSTNSRGYVPLLLETANQIHRGDGFRAEMLKEIDREVVSCKGIDSHSVVGTSVINVGLNRSAKRDMLLFFNLVFVLLIAISWMLLRSWRDMLVLLGVATCAVMMTMGLVAITGHQFNILTIMMPTVLIALSVANLVHLVHAFHHYRVTGMTASEAAHRAVREVRLPALGTTLTTVIGFLSLSVSDMPPVRQLALFSAAGIILAWMGTLAVAPVLLARVWEGRTDWPTPARARHVFLNAWSNRLPGIGRLLLIALVVSLPVLAGLHRLEANTNYVDFFRSGSRVRQAYEQVDRAGMAQSTVDVVVRSRRPLEDDELDPFLDAVEKLRGVRAVLARDRVRDLKGFVADNGRAVRVVLFSEFLGNDAVGALVRRIEDHGAELLPRHTEVRVTGSPVLWERMDVSIVRTQRNSLLLVALGTFVLLAVLFRNLRLAAIGWLCSALPVGLILGLMGWLGVPVTLATVLIAGIALGLAVDDTVHFVIAFRRRLAVGSDRSTAVRESLVTVGERMIVTSLILAGGFSVMAFSDFMPTASFGMFTALTILIALVADLTLLPGMLGAEPIRVFRLSTKPNTRVRGSHQVSGSLRGYVTRSDSRNR